MISKNALLALQSLQNTKKNRYERSPQLAGVACFKKRVQSLCKIKSSPEIRAANILEISRHFISSKE